MMENVFLDTSQTTRKTYPLGRLTEVGFQRCRQLSEWTQQIKGCLSERSTRAACEANDCRRGTYGLEENLLAIDLGCET